MGAAWAALFFALIACSDGIGQPLLSAEGGSAGVGGTDGQSGDTTMSTEGGAETSLGGKRSAAAASFGGKGSRFQQDDERAGENGSFGKAVGSSFSDSDREIPELPDSAHCASVVDWPERAADAELDFFDFVNLLRVQGKRCSEEEDGAPLPPLESQPELWCAARLHSRDMATRDFEGHVNPDGEDAAARIARAGYDADDVGESIATYDQSDIDLSEGRLSAFDVVLELLRTRQGDCETLLDPRFDAIGVGYHEGYWTIDLATTAQP